MMSTQGKRNNTAEYLKAEGGGIGNTNKEFTNILGRWEDGPR